MIDNYAMVSDFLSRYLSNGFADEVNHVLKGKK